MANIKSQKKRILIAERNNLANSSFKTRMRHSIKKVKLAVEAKDLATAEKLLPEAISLIDKSVKNGVQHINTASRQKATLMRAVNSLKA
ncbi:MAG: 30S ribosomal protein S20 [Bacilli bacterium]|jgi:small subunit ribosomal protein S20|nr:30S ribosomal protein S20 [Bacilli bacterium]